MSLRISILGIIWLLAMILLFLTPIKSDAPVFFNLIPGRAIVYFFLFWGCTHIWIGILKKQFKYNLLKKKAFFVVVTGAFTICLIAEVLLFIFGINDYFQYWNLILGILGALTGLLSFRLLYPSRY